MLCKVRAYSPKNEYVKNCKNSEKFWILAKIWYAKLLFCENSTANLHFLVSDNNHVGCENYQDGEYWISYLIDFVRRGEKNTVLNNHFEGKIVPYQNKKYPQIQSNKLNNSVIYADQ